MKAESALCLHSRSVRRREDDDRVSTRTEIRRWRCIRACACLILLQAIVSPLGAQASRAAEHVEVLVSIIGFAASIGGWMESALSPRIGACLR